MFGATCAVLYSAAASSGVLTNDLRRGVAIVFSMWLSTFRKNFPLAYHIRGFLSLAGRAVVALARGRGFARPGDVLTTEHRVLLGDLDFNLHQNNAVYPEEVDIQRFGYFIDLFAGHVPYAFPLVNWGWKLANGGVTTWFLVELRLLAAYKVHTRLAGIDAKWFYLRSDYVDARSGRLHALTITRIVVKIARKTVPPADALARLGYAESDIAALLDRGAEGPTSEPPTADVVAGPTLSAVIAALTGPLTGGDASPLPAADAKKKLR